MVKTSASCLATSFNFVVTLVSCIQNAIHIMYCELTCQHSVIVVPVSTQSLVNVLLLHIASAIKKKVFMSSYNSCE